MANNNVREPKQRRSIEKKEKILAAAYKLFCEKGYYKTNTPEIAVVADVSTGCLYSYFKNKHDIFLEVYEQYQKSFDRLHEELYQNLSKLNADPAVCLRKFIEMLIDAHEESKEFQKELAVLYYSDAEIASRLDEQNRKIQSVTLSYFEQFRGRLKAEDYEAAAIVSTDIINAIVERISFYSNSVDRERILNEGVKALCAYLF